MNNLRNKSYFLLEDHQKHLILLLKEFYPVITDLSNQFVEETGRKQKIEQIKQVLRLILLHNCFGITTDTLIKLVSPDNAPDLYKYTLGRKKYMISRSWLYKTRDDISSWNFEEIERISAQFQDKYYLEIGETSRNVYIDLINSSNSHINLPIEGFFGHFKPSDIFPDYSVHKRGELLPILNLRIYQHINHISSINELVGLVKTIEIIDGKPIFRLGARMGFIGAPPGINAIYKKINLLEGILHNLDDLVTKVLVSENLIDLTIVSVDSTSISVDSRDKSRTTGTCSRGNFNGYKCSIACDAKSVPLFAVIEEAKEADINMYRSNMAPIYSLEQASAQMLWIETADAAYSSTYLIDDIENEGHINFIDINPRNSSILKNLKKNANFLAEISKKIINKGLSLDERSEWKKDITNYCQSQPNASVSEIKTVLKNSLHKLAMRGRNRALNPKERQEEKRLRKKVVDSREELRKSNQKYSKQIGLTLVPIGTVEWFLIYHIRGQNEGINGILKKNGNLLGNQQKTTWIYGKQKVANRVKSIITLTKYSILIHYKITGEKSNGMRFFYNWDRYNFIFAIFPRR